MNIRITRLSRAGIFLALLPFVAVAASRKTPPPSAKSAAVEPSAIDSGTRVQMQNVDFFVDPRIALRIRHLTGSMRSKTSGPIVFDDKSAFVFNVENAEVGLKGLDLGALMNDYVFNYPGSPLSHLTITISNGEIVQKGLLKKIAPIPFEIHATLSATPDGRIKIHPTRTQILGLHVDKLMHGLGLPLEKIINLDHARGATISGNDIYLNPGEILPPPQIHGRVSSASVEGDEVVMQFGSPNRVAGLTPPLSGAANYMYYRGGTLRFGKMMMLDADMMITELDSGTAFRFDLDHYQPQLVAGYSRTLKSGALVVWMKDIDRIDDRR